MISTSFEKLQDRIGYRFNDAAVLVAAFTHKSYVNEHKSAESYERFEFLGDCALNFLVGEWLYIRDPAASEGELSKMRAAHVSKWALSRLVDMLGLIEHLRVGAGVDKADFSIKRRSDLYEALVGAVCVDGGLEACRALLGRTFYGLVVPERDCKTELNEYAVRRGIEIAYSEPISGIGGGFETTVSVGGVKYVGRANKEHDSAIAAARAAITGLKI